MIINIANRKMLQVCHAMLSNVLSNEQTIIFFKVRLCLRVSNHFTWLIIFIIIFTILNPSSIYSNANTDI